MQPAITASVEGLLRFVRAHIAQTEQCNFENGDGGRPERNWAARSQAARSNSWSMK